MELETELLEGPEIEEFTPPAEYKGSLDYIDSLPTQPPILKVTSQDVSLARDATDISNAYLDVDVQLQPQALPRDNRRFNPIKEYDPGELVPGSSRVVNYEIPPRPMREWEAPYRRKIENPYHSILENKVMRRNKNKLYFNSPNLVDICVKRKIRREVMSAFGLIGMYFPMRRHTGFERIYC